MHRESKKSEEDNTIVFILLCWLVQMTQRELNIFSRDIKIDKKFLLSYRIAFEKSRGVEALIECLTGDPLFGYIHLIKSERSATASLADKLDAYTPLSKIYNEQK